MTISDELLQVADDAAAVLAQLRSGELHESLSNLEKACEQAKRAWSGSNLGYHASVYYEGFEPPPPNAQFSPEWGLMDVWPTHQPDPGWQTMDAQAAVAEIVRRAGHPNIDEITKALATIRDEFSALKERAISILTSGSGKKRDAYLNRKLAQIETLKAASEHTIERTLAGSGAGWSRDSTAVTQGVRVAPHQSLSAIVLSRTVSENGLSSLESSAREAAIHLKRSEPAIRTGNTPTERSSRTSNILTDLFEQYDELATDVARSKHQFFQGNVKRWLDFLDSAAPFARPILQQLEMSADFKTWFAPYRVAAVGGGSKAPEWPAEQKKRLGMQLLLFRGFASGDIDPKFFALSLLGSGKNANDGTADIVNQIFLPMSKELRRYLKQATTEDVQMSVDIPASDRVVSLDHNSETYKETTGKLDELAVAVRQTNDYPDTDDKEQKLAELSAGRGLLSSARVRAGAILAVLKPPLLWFVEKFSGGIIGQLAIAAWHLLKMLIGL